jgi:hypothetical protein
MGCAFTAAGVARNNSVHIKRMSFCILILFKRTLSARLNKKSGFETKLYLLPAHFNGQMILILDESDTSLGLLRLSNALNRDLWFNGCDVGPI